MLTILAQSTQPTVVVTEPSWMFWVQAVVMPLLLFSMAWVLRRLAAGDEKFEKLSSTLATVHTEVTNLIREQEHTRQKIGELFEANGEVKTEGAGVLGNFRAEMHRDFVRRAEYDKFRDQVLANQTEILERLAALGAGRKS